MALTNQPLMTIGLADNSAEVKSVSVRLAVAADYDTAESALAAAVMGVVNGTKKEQGTYDRDYDNNRVIGSQVSDVGHTWLVTHRDTVTGRLGTFRIPTANGNLRKTASDELDPTTQAYGDLVAAVNSYVRNSSTGNAVVFESCVYNG